MLSKVTYQLGLRKALSSSCLLVACGSVAGGLGVTTAGKDGTKDARKRERNSLLNNSGMSAACKAPVKSQTVAVKTVRNVGTDYQKTSLSTGG